MTSLAAWERDRPSFSATSLVVSYTNAGGESPRDETQAVLVALDNRTQHVREVPQETSYELGEWNGHEETAVLGNTVVGDCGSLRMTTADLEIATWGPRAALDRTYCSSRTTSTCFWPGWRFAFEQKLLFTPNASTPQIIDYQTAIGSYLRFAKSGSTWLAPNGMVATLAKPTSDWTLTLQDKSVLTFDGTSGKLKSEADANGNTVAYTWAGEDLTITAANGQTIAVDVASGKIDKATYATSAGTREVDYSTTSSQLTYFPNTSVARTVSYAYDGSSKLTEIKQHDWPSSGQSAVQRFAYTSGSLSDVYFADYFTTDTAHTVAKSDAKAHIDYGTSGANSATVTRWGTVNDIANTPVYEEYTWNPVGTPATTVDPHDASESGAAFAWRYEYSPDNQVVRDHSPLNTHTTSIYDRRGNLVLEADELGHRTTYSYDANDRLTSAIDPQGSTTNCAYDACGNPTAEAQRLNASEWSRSEWSYATVLVGGYSYKGACSQERQLITATYPNPSDWTTFTNPTWAVTDFSSYASSGSPGTTAYNGVVLSDGGAAQTLEMHGAYDAFGNLTSTSELHIATPSSFPVDTTTVYDLGGRESTETDSASVVTHHVYDALGYEKEYWLSHSATQVKADWTLSVFDALGRETLTTYRLSTSQNPSGSVESQTSTSYDGIGRETSSDGNTRGGQPSKSVYDARGNETRSWEEGVASYGVTRASRDDYDPLGRTLASFEPGSATTGSTFSYRDDGTVASESYPGGGYTEYEYDAADNILAEFEPKEGGGQAETSYVYDTASRPLATNNPDDTTEQDVYDLAGRAVKGRWGELDAYGVMVYRPWTIESYNVMGWPIRTEDADGIVTTWVYDGAGREIQHTTAGESTDTCYVAAQRVDTRTDSEDRQVDYDYDVFGRCVREKHTTAAGPVRDLQLTLDSLGRPTGTEDTELGVTHTWSYPQNQLADTVETIVYGGQTTTVTTGNDGLEHERSSNLGGGTTVSRTVDTRDDGDRITQTTFAGDIVWHWTYDDAGRLVRQWGSGSGLSGYASGASGTDAYSFGASTGRKTSENLQLGFGGANVGSYAYNDAGQLACADATSYAFKNGRSPSEESGQSSVAYSYDSSTLRLGSQSTGTVFSYSPVDGSRIEQTTGSQLPITYSYAGIGRLAEYDNPNAPGTNGTYSYDARGTRIESVVARSGVTTTTQYTYESLNLLSLFAVRSDGVSWRVTYLYDQLGRPYAGVYRSPEDSASTVVFELITNDRGDVLELVDTDGQGFASYRYDAWGKPTASNVRATALVPTAQLAADIRDRQILRYAGYCYDTESGFYYLMARYYDPSTRQFLSRDAAGADGEASPYQYCGENPVECTDPSGYGTLWGKTSHIWDLVGKKWRDQHGIWHKYTVQTSYNAWVRANDATKRLKIVAANRVGKHYEPKIFYNNTSQKKRWSGMRRKLHLMKYPTYADCSSWATWTYYSAGARDPNGKHYKNSATAGWSYTGTLASHCLAENGRKTDLTKLKPGDIVLYGSNPWDGPNSHAAVYVAKGKVISHGSSSGPQIRTPVTYWGTVWGGCRYKL
jgi:RHS repeat-associated protein